MPRYAYLDASAIVKLVAREAETAALENALAHLDGILTSRLSVVEVTRAAARSAKTKVLQTATEVLGSFVLVELTSGVTAAAGRAQPTELRSLDAIHLATAQSLHLEDDGELAFITYDKRLAAAASRAGLTVVTPR